MGLAKDCRERYFIETFLLKKRTPVDSELQSPVQLDKTMTPQTPVEEAAGAQNVFRQIRC